MHLITQRAEFLSHPCRRLNLNERQFRVGVKVFKQLIKGLIIQGCHLLLQRVLRRQSNTGHSPKTEAHKQHAKD